MWLGVWVCGLVFEQVCGRKFGWEWDMYRGVNGCVIECVVGCVHLLLIGERFIYSIKRCSMEQITC